MNLYFVTRDGALVTPELTGTILEGVTRSSILEIAKELGLEPEERRIPIEEWKEGAATGDIVEIFACGTAAVVTPGPASCAGQGCAVDTTACAQGDRGPLRRGDPLHAARTSSTAVAEDTSRLADPPRLNGASSMGPVDRPGTTRDGSGRPRCLPRWLVRVRPRRNPAAHGQLVVGRMAAAWSAAAARRHRDRPRRRPDPRAGCTISNRSSARAARRSAATAPSSTRWRPTGSSRRTASRRRRRRTSSPTCVGPCRRSPSRPSGPVGPSSPTATRTRTATGAPSGRCAGPGARSLPSRSASCSRSLLTSPSRSSCPPSRRSSATVATCTSPARTAWRRSMRPG